MIRLYIISAFLFTWILTAQEKSYLKFTPAIDKDTLDFIGIDELKYDINIHYHNNSINSIDISGKIGLINKYALENPGTSFTIFSGNEKKLELTIKRYAKTSEAKPNFIEYNVANYRYNESDFSFSIGNIRKIVEKLQLYPLYFRMQGKILIFRDDLGYSKIMDFSRTTLQVFFHRNDTRYVNVFDDGELILKIPYKELLSFSK